MQELDAPLTPASPELAATLALAQKRRQEKEVSIKQLRVDSGSGGIEQVRTSELLHAVRADQVFVEVQALKVRITICA
jgi:hypothetical protein